MKSHETMSLAIAVIGGCSPLTYAAHGDGFRQYSR